MSTSHRSMQPGLAGRFGWRPVVMIVAVLLMAFSVAGVFTSAPANAAVVSVSQCDDQQPNGAGATLVMNCDISVTNTINGGLRSSVVTISRQCTLDPCTGSTSQSFSDVVTSVDQCNRSDNDASHPINCNVSVINNISADTPGAQPVTAATVNQCVGSGANLCSPASASTTSATVTQCNGSGNGGASGTVACTVPGSTVSPAIPIMINQCNGTGNAGASIVTCSASIVTNITASAVVPTTPPATTPPPTTPPPTTPPATTPTTPAPVTTTPATTPTTPAPVVVPPVIPAPVVVPTAPGTLATPTPAPVPANTSTQDTSNTSNNSNTPGTPAAVATPTSPATLETQQPQVGAVPTGGVQTGGGSTAGLQHIGLLTLSSVLWLAAGCSALLRRRTIRRG